jgi:hypothetical protein
MNLIPTEKHTYGWYTKTHFLPGGEYFIVDRTGVKPCFEECDESLQDHNLKELGVFDKVPTPENMNPLIDMYSTWWETVEKDWNEYTKNQRGPLVTLHWILSQVLQDPTCDPEIIRYALKSSGKFTICCVYNPSCPEDVVRDLVSKSKTKNDPTTKTNGGEVTCFVLANKKLPSHLVDLCARHTKKATNQRSVVSHPNVSKETLVFLSKEGKSPRVKRDALEALVEKGWLTVG